MSRKTFFIQSIHSEKMLGIASASSASACENCEMESNWFRCGKVLAEVVSLVITPMLPSMEFLKTCPEKMHPCLLVRVTIEGEEGSQILRATFFHDTDPPRIDIFLYESFHAAKEDIEHSRDLWCKTLH